MLKSYKYRIYPNEDQINSLNHMFGCVRFVYNLGLETKIAAYLSNKTKIDCFELINQMKQLKDTDAPWLKDCVAQSLQMSLRNLDNAYNCFFKGGGFPKFKNKKNKQSIHFPQDVKCDFVNTRVFIPKIKWVKCIYDRKFDGDIKTVTLSKTYTNKYFISILVDNKKELPNKKRILEETSIGIDLGIKKIATLSDGTIFENPKFFKKSQEKLKKAQRSLNRKIKGSKSYEKQRIIVAKLHEKIKNQREDYLHKITTSIVKKWDTIVLENLDVKHMMKNHLLALSIGEVGWNKMCQMLKYKAEWSGKNIIQIGRFEPSSKMCSNCGTINKELKLSDREWICKKCGINHDRDRNAADNIKKFGLGNKPLTVNVN